MVESNISANEANKFSVSLIAFWVKGAMSVTDRFLNIDMPNTVLFGLIPAGKNKQQTPLSGVTNVGISNSYKLGAMLFGLAFAIGGFAEFGSSAGSALLLIIIGALLFLSGIKTRLSFERAGVIQTIDVPFFEASHMKEFAEQVNKKLGLYQDDRNVRMQTDRQIHNNNTNTKTIVNAIKGQDAQDKPKAEAADNVKFCPSCGAQNDISAAFCTHCGTKLN